MEDLVDDKEAPLNTIDYPALEFEMTRLRDRGYNEFRDRLADSMDLSRVRAILSSAVDWNPMHILMHAETMMGDSMFTEQWKDLVFQEVQDFEDRYAQAWIDYYEEYAAAADSADARHMYGFHLMNNEHYEEAIAQYKRALSINPRRNNTYFNIGASHEYMELYDLALKNYAAELKVDPFDEDVPFRRGRVFVKLEKYEEALRELDSAIDLEEDPALHYYRGKAYEGLGEESKAAQQYREALRLDPFHKEALVALHRIESELD